MSVQDVLKTLDVRSTDLLYVVSLGLVACLREQAIEANDEIPRFTFELLRLDHDFDGILARPPTRSPTTQSEGRAISMLSAADPGSFHLMRLVRPRGVNGEVLIKALATLRGHGLSARAHP